MTKLLCLFASLCALALLVEVINYYLNMSKNPDVKALLEREQAAHDAFMERLRRMSKE